ncbi:MAG: PfkB family carbohydrate kinase [Planctomycetota bacterium]|jgi:D-beta-D-heptose 7-phosphate kinase/D-beta-D-heptose 1-phosphate adenosyltransferase
MQELIELIEALGSPRVVLVGDFMLDRYVYGDTERISQEAPVPVLKVVRSESRTGAAGNVAAAIVALGGKADCVGTIGQDDVADELNRLLIDAGAQTGSLIRLPDRPTTVKTRYIGLAQHKNPQQIIRVDEEVVDDLPAKTQRSLRAAVRSLLSKKPTLALQDHNKGVFTEKNTPEIIADARKAGLQVIVDPALIANYRRYRGATLVTPNRYEAALASGVQITDTASLEAAGNQILLTTEADAVMITLDAEGIFLLTRDGAGRRFPARPRSVYDGTGAGDAVLAAVAIALGGGWDFAQATELANLAGGLEVERFGVVPIRREELIDELRRMIGLRGGKVVLRRQLAEELARRRSRGERIVFTNGCFDLLHMGHVRFLQQARELGSVLVVAINSDKSIRRLKGKGRPVIKQNERAEMLGSLECVDYVTIFDEDTEIPLLKLLKPDLFVKGGTTPKVVGKKAAEACGAKVMTLDLVEGLSTTKIINRILDQEK